MRLRPSSPLWGGNLLHMLRRPKANPFPEVIGTFMARDALSLAVSYLGLGPQDTVLLPAYLCREVLKPFLGKTRIQLYDVGPDLTIDPEDIGRTLRDASVKMLVIINYFGFLQPYRTEIKRIASARGVVVLEDCAHSLLTEGSGDTGDLAVYSLRKILPLPDGGGLRVNGRSGAARPDFYPQIYSDILSFLAIAKSLLNVRSETLSRAGISSRRGPQLPRAAPVKRDRRVLPLSSFAANGMGNMCFPPIVEKRRGDYALWQAWGEATGLFTPVFGDLPAGVCPMGVPVRVQGRDALKAALDRRGISAKVHWQLPVTIGGEFVNSHEISKHILTLPVYPELGARERDAIGALRTSRSREWLGLA